MLFDDRESLAGALEKYYRMNDLPADGGASDRWARYRFGPIQAIAFPNFELRNEALRRHDVHHILIDADTSPTGEGLVAAWELGSGCGKYWISWVMESQALWWGLLLAPRNALAVFARGRGSQNFFHLELTDATASKPIGEMRREMLPTNATFKARDLARLLALSSLGLISMLAFFPLVAAFTLGGFLTGASVIFRAPAKK